MDGRRSPVCLFADLHRGLSTWWSDKLFAGSHEIHARDRFSCSIFAPLLLLLLAGLLFYARLGCPLLEPEEARYAEIPRQMLAEGRWLAPVLHGEDYFQKPPLLYWLIMVCYQIFGVHDWAARLIPASAGVLTVLITYGWALRTVGPRAAFLSGIILCLSARFLYLGGMVGMDSLLCLWVVGGLACGHSALLKVEGGRRKKEISALPQLWGKENLTQRRKGAKKYKEIGYGHFSFAPLRLCVRFSQDWRRTFFFLSALCCGLGIMTKGPVAAVLIIVPLLTWTLLERRCRRVSLGWWLGYLGVVLAVAAPWYVAMSLRDPQATEDFFWLHNIVRYLAPLDHEKPAWFYLPGVLLGMLPWSLLLIPLVAYLKNRSPRWARRRPADLGFFLITFVWCLAFFSLSGCKRPAYILPALPALALILGTLLAQACLWTYRAKVFWSLGTAVLALMLFGASHYLLPSYHRHFGLRGQVRRHVDLARDMAVVCYPRRWDSVSFYLEREVASFGPDERDRLISAMQGTETLLFVKNEGAFAEVLDALPENMEFVPCGRQGWNVRVGIVKPKE